MGGCGAHEMAADESQSLQENRDMMAQSNTEGEKTAEKESSVKHDTKIADTTDEPVLSGRSCRRTLCLILCPFIIMLTTPVAMLGVAVYGYKALDKHLHVLMKTAPDPYPAVVKTRDNSYRPVSTIHDMQQCAPPDAQGDTSQTCHVKAGHGAKSGEYETYPGKIQNISEKDYRKMVSWTDVPWAFDLDKLPCHIPTIDFSNPLYRWHFGLNYEPWIKGKYTDDGPLMIVNIPGRDTWDYRHFDTVYNIMKNRTVPMGTSNKMPIGPWGCIIVEDMWKTAKEERKKKGVLNTTGQMFHFSGDEDALNGQVCNNFKDIQSCIDVNGNNHRLVTKRGMHPCMWMDGECIARCTLSMHWHKPLEKIFKNPIWVWEGSQTNAFGFDLRGLPFHNHAPALNERHSGRKLWAFYRWRNKFARKLLKNLKDGDASLPWILETLPRLPKKNRPLVCMQHPGELMVVTNFSIHLTVNIGDGHHTITDSSPYHKKDGPPPSSGIVRDPIY